MRLAGRDPEQLKYPLTFPTHFEASRGAAAERWAVSAVDGDQVVVAAESLIEFAGPEASNFIDLLKRESPKFCKEDILEAIQTSLVRPSGYLQKLITVAGAAADYDTYFLSWWD
jgi:hypothetical protein